MAIKTIAIVHHVHTDFGYTDHPQQAKLEHVKYIDNAIDYVLASSHYPEGARFCWTQEQLYPLRQWWEGASEARKKKFFEAVKTGRLEITGTPFNVTAFMDRDEWDVAMHWIEDSLWDACDIRSAMQIDINGMHTGGMEAAYDRGVKNFWIGPNFYLGVPPMPAPSAFWWKIAEGKKVFVWLNPAYNDGYQMFNENWRQGPVPNYSDLRYRPPEAGDIWACDDESMQRAYEKCLKSVARMEGRPEDGGDDNFGFTKSKLYGGYDHEVLPVSLTSQWRLDNDPPFYPIVDFVKKWNERGWQPRLVLCTASQAMDMVKAEWGEDIPTYEGQWIDWWANGNASAPVEFAWCREAKRTLRAAESAVFGPLTEDQKKTVRQVRENLCMYDEHTFGSWQSVSAPYSFANRSQAAEKNIYVYRALDGAQCLLADRARAVTAQEKNKIVIFDPADAPMTVMIELPVNCLRGDYRSIICDETGERWPLMFIDGISNFSRPSSAAEFSAENVARTFSDRCEKQAVRFGPVQIPAGGVLHLTLSEEVVEQLSLQVEQPQIETDANGWPVYLQFAGQNAPVIDGIFGQIVSVQADGFSPRWNLIDMFEQDDEAERERMRHKLLHEVEASYGRTNRRQEGGLICFEQELIHDSMRYAKRILTVDLLQKRIRLELRMDRHSNFAPEVLFLRFHAVSGEEHPWLSNAGVPFRPELDQIPGSCMDFYAIDGTVRYPNGWLLHCIDNALVTFGSTSVMARKCTTQGPITDVYVRLLDNTWNTNFAANPCGLMQFRFDAAAEVLEEAAKAVVCSMETEPVIVVKTGYK